MADLRHPLRGGESERVRGRERGRERETKKRGKKREGKKENKGEFRELRVTEA